MYLYFEKYNWRPRFLTKIKTPREKKHIFVVVIRCYIPSAKHRKLHELDMEWIIIWELPKTGEWVCGTSTLSRAWLVYNRSHKLFLYNMESYFCFRIQVIHYINNMWPSTPMPLFQTLGNVWAASLLSVASNWKCSLFITSIRQTGTTNVMLTAFLFQKKTEISVGLCGQLLSTMVQILERIFLIDLPPLIF